MADSVYKQKLMRPLNAMCVAAQERLGKHIKLVSLSTDNAKIVHQDGARAATSDKLLLNNWLDSNPRGGFGVIPEYSDYTCLWIPNSTSIKQGFNLSKTVENSPYVNLLTKTEDDDWELYGVIHFLDVPTESIPVGVIAGGVNPDIPNSGCYVLNPRHAVPVGGWSYNKEVGAFRKQLVIKVVWHDEI